jgi:hypothetical protein
VEVFASFLLTTIRPAVYPGGFGEDSRPWRCPELFFEEGGENHTDSGFRQTITTEDQV